MAKCAKWSRMQSFYKMSLFFGQSPVNFDCEAFFFYYSNLSPWLRPLIYLTALIAPYITTMTITENDDVFQFKLQNESCVPPQFSNISKSKYQNT